MRHFTIVSVYKGSTDLEVSGGRYTSKIPVAAAKKAFSQTVQTKKIDGETDVVVKIRETTQDSSHKEYSYKVSKVPQEKEIKIGDKIVRYKFAVKATAIKVPIGERKVKKFAQKKQKDAVVEEKKKSTSKKSKKIVDEKTE